MLWNTSGFAFEVRFQFFLRVSDVPTGKNVHRNGDGTTTFVAFQRNLIDPAELCDGSQNGFDLVIFQ
jgi:hypothetical protein